MSSNYLAVGYECNHSCICCPLGTYDKLHKKLEYNEIIERLNMIQRQNDDKHHIVLSGGEPMIHPDFFKILEAAAQKEFYITVLSNSSQCKNKQFVKSLCDYISIEKFEVVTAIHSSYPKVHDRITGVSGSLIETLEGLDNLMELNIPVTLKHIFNKKSIATLEDTFCYLQQHFSPKAAFQFTTMDYCGKAGKNVNDLFITIKEIQPHIENLLDYLEDQMTIKREISIIESPLCMTDPFYWKYFQSSGSDLDCYIAPNAKCDLICYNVPSECGCYYPPCDKCYVKKWCSGIWRSAYSYFGTKLLQPIEGRSK